MSITKIELNDQKYQLGVFTSQEKNEIKKAAEKVDTIKNESFTLTNVSGWKRALEFTGVSLALNFALSSTDAMAAVSGILNTIVNTSCLVSQLSSRDVDRLHRIDKVGVLFRGDRTCLFIHTSANIASMQLVISGSYEQAVYQNKDEDLPDGAYIYEFGIDSGIIADKAIADENGNNIAKTLDNKTNCLKITPPTGIDQQWLTLFTLPHIASFHCEIKAARWNVPNGGMLCDVILDLLTVTEGENWGANWTQMGNYNAAISFRVISENNWMKFECLFNAPYPVFEITWVRNDFGDITPVNTLSTGTGSTITEWSTAVNVGIIADRAKYNADGTDLTTVANACTGITNSLDPAPPSNTAKDILEKILSYDNVSKIYLNRTLVPNGPLPLGNPSDTIHIQSLGSSESPYEIGNLHYFQRVELSNSYVKFSSTDLEPIRLNANYSTVIYEQNARFGGSRIFLSEYLGNSYIITENPNTMIDISARYVRSCTFNYCIIGGDIIPVGESYFSNSILNITSIVDIVDIPIFFKFNNCSGRIYCKNGIYDCATLAPIS